jgi:hypothetical protein
MTHEDALEIIKLLTRIDIGQTFELIVLTAVVVVVWVRK